MKRVLVLTLVFVFLFTGLAVAQLTSLESSTLVDYIENCEKLDREYDNLYEQNAIITLRLSDFLVAPLDWKSKQSGSTLKLNLELAERTFEIEVPIKKQTSWSFVSKSFLAGVIFGIIISMSQNGN